MVKERLRYLMKLNGICSISSLASETKVSKSVLHGYLQDVNPSLKNLVKLSDYFNISIDFLVGRDEGKIILNKSLRLENGNQITVIIKNEIIYNK